MVAEITIGRNTKKNPVGAFKALSDNSYFYALIGMWGVLCGVMILAFYTVIAGWTVSYVFEEIFFYAGMNDWATWISDTNNGPINAVFATIFMGATVSIILGGVSDGIERATKFMMPLLLAILVVMIGYVLLQPGAGVGLEIYLFPDFSKVTADLVFAAMGQAFFSLSLGMGALITYGSYLSKKENVPEAAAYVTLTDTFIAFLAGLLIIPTMYMAQAQGVEIFDSAGNLVASTALIFQVLPELFHELGGVLGLVFGTAFFFLLSIAALTSTISLLEVPVSYAIDEYEITRKKAAQYIGLGILLISLIISFDTSLIGIFVTIFNNVGLPLGGFLICLFLGYYWKTDNALTEMESGFGRVKQTLFAKVWPFFIKVIAPLAILYNLLSGLGLI
jgi:NSS family neurotransmitter:Na+ symporter